LENRAGQVDECKRELVLKNSCFAKTGEIWEIEDVYQDGDRRLQGFLARSFSTDFSACEFFNSHA
jgi:hypothetical protein